MMPLCCPGYDETHWILLFQSQNISEQVAAYMRDPTKMVRQMQQRRSTIGVFGAVR
jgi:hypothetical protein